MAFMRRLVEIFGQVSENDEIVNTDQLTGSGLDWDTI